MSSRPSRTLLSSLAESRRARSANTDSARSVRVAKGLALILVLAAASCSSHAEILIPDPGLFTFEVDRLDVAPGETLHMTGTNCPPKIWDKPTTGVWAISAFYARHIPDPATTTSTPRAVVRPTMPSHVYEFDRLTAFPLSSNRVGERDWAADIVIPDPKLANPGPVLFYILSATCVGPPPNNSRVIYPPRVITVRPSSTQK